MAQETFLKLLEKAKSFKVWIDKVKKESTYKPVWKKWFKWEYTPTLTYQTYTAAHEAARVASVINFGSGKPIRTRPTAGQLSGTLGSMGDMFQMDALMIRKSLELEKRLKQDGKPMAELYDFLFPDFEMAVVAPHKTLDLWTGQGMSTGKVVVDSTNNPDGIAFELDLGIKGYKTQGPVWGINTQNSTPITDIRNVLDSMKARGFKPNIMRMTLTTFNKMIASDEFKAVFKLNFGKVSVSPANFITPEMVNTYLSGIGLPTIEIMEDMLMLPDGTSINPFADDRVSFANTGLLGTMQYTFANEKEDPEEGKSYQEIDNVLISYWRANGGRFLEYELNAFPAFSSYKQMAVLDTSSREE